MTDSEGTELLAALHQTVSFAEGLLEVNDRLVKALSGEGDPPTEADLAYLREGQVRWREQVEGLRRRLASYTLEPLKAAVADRGPAYSVQNNCRAPQRRTGMSTATGVPSSTTTTGSIPPFACRRTRFPDSTVRRYLT